MFGYVRVHKPELKVREYEVYRGAYCGLCRSMGKCTGQCSRMTLSYDFAFLALLRVTLTRDALEFATGRCIAHPFTRRSYLKRNPSLDYCAGAAAILNYHKVKDDISDEKGFRRLSAVALLPFVAYSRRRALKKLGLASLDKSVSDGLTRLSEIEKSKISSVDAPAAAFGDILGNIICFGLEGNEKRIAYSLGCAVGKWIYAADALEDWREDGEKGRYNPFILLYEKPAPTPDDIESISISLKNQLFSAESAADLIDFSSEDIKNIIWNILYLGLPHRVESIGKPKKRKDKSERIKDK